jgi:D-xylose transport system substrate-binding protein
MNTNLTNHATSGAPRTSSSRSGRRSHRRRPLAVVFAVGVLLAACGDDDEGSATSTESSIVSTATDAVTPASATESSDDLTIAFLMPCSTCADRFENQDKPLFIAAVEALAPGAEVIANNAEGDSAKQVQQAEAAITNGADVIVISPLDESAGAAIAELAAAEGIPVVSYDGLLTGAEVQFYVSFDNESVGSLQAEFLAEQTPGGGQLIIINGDQDIAPGRQFKAGAHAVLDPLVADGTFTIGYEDDITNFDPADAQSSVEQALTSVGDDVVGVLVANDGMAGGAVTALEDAGLAGNVLVTGQDATDAGLQRVLLGTQSMTVYKAIAEEARVAATAAVALARGDTATIEQLATSTTDNGAGDVPTVLLVPTVVTADNLFDTVVADGFVPRERICTEGIPCP